MRYSVKLLLGVGVAALVFAATAQAVTADGVITGRSDVWDPAYGVDPDTGLHYLAFTQYTKTGHAGAWYQKNTSRKARLNLTGSGWAWGVDPTTKTISFQVATGQNSDVKLFDWSTGKRASAGPIVNTDRWEYQPSLSGSSLLFARLNAAARPDVRHVYLYDTLTQQRTLLDSFVGKKAAGMLWVGQANGDWAVWEKDTNGYKNDTVHRYQISTGQTEQIVHPDGRLDYASSVTPDGTIYFIRSGLRCGQGVKLRSVDTSDTLTTLFALPAGWDVSKTFAVANQDGSTTVYYDSWRCADPNGNGNIYRVTIPAGGAIVSTSPPSRVSGAAGGKPRPTGLARSVG